MPTTIELNNFKKTLKIKRLELEELNLMSEEATHAVELDQSKVGRLSRMDAIQQQAMNVEQKRRRQRNIQLISAALIRIKNGDYGWCLACGEAINPKRLEVDPAAAYCTQCADSHTP